MKNLKNECRIKVEGVNIDRIYKTLMKNKVNMSSIDRPDYKILYFNVKTNEVKKTLKLIDSPSYKIKIEKYFGASSIYNFLKKRFAFVISFVIFFSLLFVNTRLISDIKIYGNEMILTEQILQVLSEKGVKKLALIDSIDTEKCEEILLNNFEQMSLISVVKVGNNLIINVKEKTLNNLINDLAGSIVANYYGQITEIEVMQGTALVKQGDIVKQGDVLVGNYYFSGDKKVECKANAKIKQKIWFSHSETFLNEQIVYERTGNKIVDSKVSLCGLVIKQKVSKNNFEYFETIESENYLFKNNFIPLMVHKTTYYETKKNVLSLNFDDYKDSILQKCYDKAKEKVATSLTVTKTFDTINNIEGGYVVSAYIECETYI